MSGPKIQLTFEEWGVPLLRNLATATVPPPVVVTRRVSRLPWRRELAATMSLPAQGVDGALRCLVRDPAIVLPASRIVATITGLAAAQAAALVWPRTRPRAVWWKGRPGPIDPGRDAGPWAVRIVAWPDTTGDDYVPAVDALKAALLTGGVVSSVPGGGVAPAGSLAATIIAAVSEGERPTGVIPIIPLQGRKR